MKRYFSCHSFYTLVGKRNMDTLLLKKAKSKTKQNKNYIYKQMWVLVEKLGMRLKQEGGWHYRNDPCARKRACNCNTLWFRINVEMTIQDAESWDTVACRHGRRPPTGALLPRTIRGLRHGGRDGQACEPALAGLFPGLSGLAYIP